MRTYLTSVARIAQFNDAPYRVERLDRSRWSTGDYVVVEVSSLHGLRDIELEKGSLPALRAKLMEALEAPVILTSLPVAPA